MDASPRRVGFLGNCLVWPFVWSEATVYISADSGDILLFSAAELEQNARSRFEAGDAPTMLTAEEATRQATEFAQKMGLPVDETRAFPEIVAFKLKSDSSENERVGFWSISFRRYFQGYTVPDYFWVWIEPYERRVVDVLVDWGTPLCETVVTVSEARATQLALEGFAERGISVVIGPRSQLAIMRPNFAWTEYSLPSREVPFSRLVWIVGVARSDGSPIGVIWIDAVSGEWLGGDVVTGIQTTMKQVPSQANEKAYLVSTFVRSEQAGLYADRKQGPIVIKPQDKTRWSALGALIATLRPQKDVLKGASEEMITFSGKNKTYHLKRVDKGLTLTGPDVPGGILSFTVGKEFHEKLTHLTTTRSSKSQ